MRDHELELIAALVEGRLEDEAEARALVASSPELRIEYEAQKTAYEALSAVGSANLTETERAGLRRDVWTELRAEHVAATPQKTPWYYRWVPALAGMFIVVGLVSVIGNQGGDDSGGEEGVAQLSAETTVAATSDATEAADGSTSGESESDGETAGESSGETAGGADSSQDEAMEEESDGGAEPPEDRSVTPAASSFYSTEADMVRSGALEETPVETSPDPVDALAPCLEEASLAGYEPLAILTSPIQTEEVDLESVPVPSAENPVIVAIPEGADMSSAVIAFVDRGSCEVIHLDR